MVRRIHPSVVLGANTHYPDWRVMRLSRFRGVMVMVELFRAPETVQDDLAAFPGPLVNPLVDRWIHPLVRGGPTHSRAFQWGIPGFHTSPHFGLHFLNRLRGAAHQGVIWPLGVPVVYPFASGGASGLDLVFSQARSYDRVNPPAVEARCPWDHWRHTLQPPGHRPRNRPRRTRRLTAYTGKR
jgi:hypothetical protein